MKKTSLIFAALMAPSVAMAWPWSTDMMNQPSIKPQEGVMTPFPARSVPVTGIPTTVANREETRGMVNPIGVSEASIRQGRNLYKIYCAACHGRTGKADSPVSSKVGAIDLTDGYVQNDLSDGWLWGTITFGSYVMPSYGVVTEQGGSNDLSVEERWHVVNYIKHALVKDAAAAAVAAK